MKWNKREKTLLLITLLLFALVVMKSLFYDGYEPQSKEESLAIEKVHGGLEDSFLIKKKVVGLKPIKDGSKEEQEVEFGFMITLRNYLFGLIPLGESRVIV